MSQVVAWIVAPVLGLILGWASHLLPFPPILRTVAAGVMASLGASLVSAVLWLTLPPPAVEIKAVSFGLAEAGLALAVSGLASAALHVALGQLGTWAGSAFLVSHRTLVVSVLAGLGGAMSFSVGAGLVGRMGS